MRGVAELRRRALQQSTYTAHWSGGRLAKERVSRVISAIGEVANVAVQTADPELADIRNSPAPTTSAAAARSG